MFKEHSYVLWGDYCTCGQECFILQNKFHPWDDVDFTISIECTRCNKRVNIDNKKAANFYSKKVLSYFGNIEGQIIDLGCGGGFLSEFLLKEDKTNKIYAIDNDISCKEGIEKLCNVENKIVFINMDIKDFGKLFKSKQIDYLVSRDVFMFIEDTKKYFDDITNIVSKGIRQMGWYVSNNKRMKNNLLPEQIVDELKKRDWKVSLETLDWYKSGYFIKADKII
ncbi:class I SAM-dependent methyltransferase [Clostridium tagluense]|uniref:Methyltransferase domain-containing protein n=1 Tax=Clostridium tagluense TaxID=360422 RepID=A0A401ULV6_9CLOT|nr:class I SAM-dependent methyltransferase [Clostridium tagluense]GCD10516.1 hypothetical protein Ctaglu_21390 [Clostridium tagluense]